MQCTFQRTDLCLAMKCDRINCRKSSNTNIAPIGSTLIPRGLPDNLKAIHTMLLEVKRDNDKDNIKWPKLIVITDLAKIMTISR
jgi:hypothetical protein